MGRYTSEFQRRWAARHPGVELHLIRTNSPTGGLAEGLCDLAVLRTAVGGRARPGIHGCWTRTARGFSRSDPRRGTYCWDFDPRSVVTTAR